MPLRVPPRRAIILGFFLVVAAIIAFQSAGKGGWRRLWGAAQECPIGGCTGEESTSPEQRGADNGSSAEASADSQSSASACDVPCDQGSCDSQVGDLTCHPSGKPGQCVRGTGWQVACANGCFIGCNLREEPCVCPVSGSSSAQSSEAQSSSEAPSSASSPPSSASSASTTSIGGGGQCTVDLEALDPAGTRELQVLRPDTSGPGGLYLCREQMLRVRVHLAGSSPLLAPQRIRWIEETMRCLRPLPESLPAGCDLTDEGFYCSQQPMQELDITCGSGYTPTCTVETTRSAPKLKSECSVTGPFGPDPVYTCASGDFAGTWKIPRKGFGPMNDRYEISCYRDHCDRQLCLVRPRRDLIPHLDGVFTYRAIAVQCPASARPGFDRGEFQFDHPSPRKTGQIQPSPVGEVRDCRFCGDQCADAASSPAAPRSLP